MVTGMAALLHETTKPFNGEMTLAVLQKMREFLDDTPLERLGVIKDLVLSTVPSILVDITNSGTVAVRHLARLTKGVIFAGAGLSREVGDMMADNGVSLSSAYGASVGSFVMSSLGLTKNPAQN